MKRGLLSAGRVACLVAIATIAVGCDVIQGITDSGGPLPDAAMRDATPLEYQSVDKVDLLLAIDNSGSMRENQANLMAQFSVMIRTLTDPLCVSSANPTPHACDAMNADDRPEHSAVRSLHVGIVSSDLGTPGSMVPGCQASGTGDDGRLNPIRHGAAEQLHEPWLTAPAGYRPDDCTRPDQFPSFLSFDATTNDAMAFDHDLRCNAGLYSNGCGLEQQLESVFRALVIHDAHDIAGNTDANAGFLRDDAILAILMLSDEEDGSVRDCRSAHNMPCTDALDVYNGASTVWASNNLNLRTYMYQPGTREDPTWTLDRYYDPRDPNKGLLALKPAHPERVVFGAITGVPLQIPMTDSGSGPRIDWDQLLGSPADPRNPDDFAQRNSTQAISMMSTEGPVSMRQANIDPNCTERVVPACRREGTAYSPTACTSTDQYFAWPARRIVEIARRFDEATLCARGSCGNGMIASICANSYASGVNTFTSKIQRQLVAPCLNTSLRQTANAMGQAVVNCTVRETLPAGSTACDASHGLEAPVDGPMTRMVDGVSRTVCDAHQLPTENGNPVPANGFTQGWYYDTRVDPANPSSCDHRISFTPGAMPATGTLAELQCASN